MSLFLSILYPLLGAIFGLAISAFFRNPLWLSALFIAAATALGAFASGFSLAALIVAGTIAAVLVIAAVPMLRRSLFSAPFLRFYDRIAPQLSETEQVALAAGTVGFEGELFSGKPNWSKLLSQPAPKLTAEEQAFMDGPVEEACRMTND